MMISFDMGSEVYLPSIFFWHSDDGSSVLSIEKASFSLTGRKRCQEAKELIMTAHFPERPSFQAIRLPVDGRQAEAWYPRAE